MPENEKWEKREKANLVEKGARRGHVALLHRQRQHERLGEDDVPHEPRVRGVNQKGAAGHRGAEGDGAVAVVDDPVLPLPGPDLVLGHDGLQLFPGEEAHLVFLLDVVFSRVVDLLADLLALAKHWAALVKGNFGGVLDFVVVAIATVATRAIPLIGVTRNATSSPAIVLAALHPRGVAQESIKGLVLVCCRRRRC